MGHLQQHEPDLSNTDLNVKCDTQLKQPPKKHWVNICVSHTTCFNVTALDNNMQSTWCWSIM